jgi:lipid-A-disaccharide synthase
MKYYFVAGERSGDLHGGNLLRSLRQLDSNAQFRGFGGDEMQAADMEVTVHYRDMEMMGFLSVTLKLPRIFRYIDQCQRDLLSFKPDVVVLIDYGGFNMRIAKFARAQGFRVFYYIPPKIWAWYQSRARKLNAWVDRLFLILPFEKSFYARYGLKGDYVGNPVLDAIKAHQKQDDFLQHNPLPNDRPIVALLPGSRRGELKRVVPIMAKLAQQKPTWHFAVAAVKTLPEDCYQPLRGISNVSFVWENTYNLLHHAQAAVVTSGTATLETALLQVPEVVVYKTGALEYKIASALVQVPFISLVNLIADKQVVKELIQSECTTDKIASEVDQLLNNEPYRAEVQAAYQRIFTLLNVGSASENTARLMVNYLAEKA